MSYLASSKHLIMPSHRQWWPNLAPLVLIAWCVCVCYSTHVNHIFDTLLLWHGFLDCTVSQTVPLPWLDRTWSRQLLTRLAATGRVSLFCSHYAPQRHSPFGLVSTSSEAGGMLWGGRHYRGAAREDEYLGHSWSWLCHVAIIHLCLNALKRYRLDSRALNYRIDFKVTCVLGTGIEWLESWHGSSPLSSSPHEKGTTTPYENVLRMSLSLRLHGGPWSCSWSRQWSKHRQILSSFVLRCGVSGRR